VLRLWESVAVKGALAQFFWLVRCCRNEIGMLARTCGPILKDLVPRVTDHGPLAPLIDEISGAEENGMDFGTASQVVSGVVGMVCGSMQIVEVRRLRRSSRLGGVMLDGCRHAGPCQRGQTCRATDGVG
jgi:hypothetical protein